MAVIEGGVSTSLQGVGLEDQSAAHNTIKPIPYGALGHYRSIHRMGIIALQAAGSKLWEIRNSHATNLIIPTRLILKWLPTAAHTAAIEDSLDIYKATAFSVSSTTGTVTPTASNRKTSMAAPPGNAVIRGGTVAGVAAGMTGFTMTLDTAPFFQLPQWLLLAQPTTAPVFPLLGDVFDDVNGTHPFALVQNEGIVITNRVLLGAAAGSSLYIDFSWVETTKF